MRMFVAIFLSTVVGYFIFSGEYHDRYSLLDQILGRFFLFGLFVVFGLFPWVVAIESVWAGITGRDFDGKNMGRHRGDIAGMPPDSGDGGGGG